MISTSWAFGDTLAISVAEASDRGRNGRFLPRRPPTPKTKAFSASYGVHCAACWGWVAST
ncbi:MAG: hypothetical protein H6668_19060 [Ardenticatenaceae bacterium]|nr:hypothetical protein [Ardenticatenaceae bacterium]